MHHKVQCRSISGTAFLNFGIWMEHLLLLRHSLTSISFHPSPYPSVMLIRLQRLPRISRRQARRPSMCLRKPGSPSPPTVTPYHPSQPLLITTRPTSLFVPRLPNRTPSGQPFLADTMKATLSIPRIPTPRDQVPHALSPPSLWLPIVKVRGRT